MRKAPTALLLAVLTLSACKRPEDEAAKQRIFSPEQPVGVDAKAREKLDARRLADDPALAERVLHMSRAEIATRLGSYRLATKVQLAWRMGGETAPDAGPNEATLAEDTSLLQAKDGDFHAKVENDHNQGFEAVWTGGEIFVRSRFGPYRKRRTDRSDPPQLREQTAAGLSTFDQLARGLKLGLLGDITVEGRRAVRYSVSGAGARPKRAQQGELPPVQWPEPAGAAKGAKPGPDPDTARRLSLWEKEQPVAVSGTILVDAESAAPLAWELEGSFRVAQGDKAPPAELELRTSAKSTAVGKALAIKAPAFEPEPSVPHAVKDPLRFLGRDAGVAAEQPAEEPEDEAPEDTGAQ